MKQIANRVGLGVAAVALSLAVTAGHANAQSRAYCDDYARDYANQQAGGGNIVGGAVGGAVTGAIIGGIVGGKKGAGKGALIGTGVGVTGGAISENQRWHNAYNYAYNNCMAQNTRQPVQYNRAPEPGSQAWYDYCSAKYRSFNPATGMYRTYSGQYKPCR